MPKPPVAAHAPVANPATPAFHAPSQPPPVTEEKMMLVVPLLAIDPTMVAALDKVAPPAVFMPAPEKIPACGASADPANMYPTEAPTIPPHLPRWVGVLERVVQAVGVPVEVLAVGGFLHVVVGGEEAAELVVVEPAVHVHQPVLREHLMPSEAPREGHLVERHRGLAPCVVGHLHHRRSLAVDDPHHAAHVVGEDAEVPEVVVVLLQYQYAVLQVVELAGDAILVAPLVVGVGVDARGALHAHAVHHLPPLAVGPVAERLAVLPLLYA